MSILLLYFRVKNDLVFKLKSAVHNHGIVLECQCFILFFDMHADFSL